MKKMMTKTSGLHRMTLFLLGCGVSGAMLLSAQQPAAGDVGFPPPAEGKIDFPPPPEAAMEEDRFAPPMEQRRFADADKKNAANGKRGTNFNPQGPKPEQGDAKADSKACAISPEIAQMHQRRFEIMVLLQAYHILPEEDRAVVKAELEKRVKEDLSLNLEQQKKRMHALETELDSMRKDLERQEAEANQIASQELQRLLALPPGPPRMNRPPRDKNNSVPESEMRRGEERRPPVDEAPEENAPQK